MESRFEELKTKLEEEKVEAKKRFNIALFVLSMFPLMVVVGAFLLKVIWGWFVVPLGVGEIGLAHAVGLSILFNWLTSGDMKMYDNADKYLNWTAVITTIIMRPVLVLGLAWLVHLFM